MNSDTARDRAHLGDSVENLMRAPVSPDNRGSGGSRTKGRTKKAPRAFSHVDQAMQEISPAIYTTPELAALVQLEKNAAAISGRCRKRRFTAQISAMVSERTRQVFHRQRQTYGIRLAGMSRYIRVLANILEKHPEILPRDLANQFDVEDAA